ncbi:hypothetical protein ASC78_25985 [Variovorax sp. Root318D1]|uniref:hypothetical protein n=1 Tax=Variovorax sp. Root318D1 TaxID=1736513 RepID=UPI0006FE027C|nr:hypothetical protein [Variovorax sp. Root318D1]KQU87630.1 hypothetical protein ASC78_25985 [Variovorax sp. Root318D1]
MEEPFKPAWTDLQAEARIQREILGEVHDALEAASSGSELDRLRANRDRWQALASLYEVQNSELERALWRAEQEAVSALNRFQQATKKLGRGQRRNPAPTHATQLYGLVERYRWYAELGGRPFNLTQAVRQVTARLYAQDARGVPLPAERLAKLVKDRLADNLSAYRKVRRLRESPRGRG